MFVVTISFEQGWLMEGGGCWLGIIAVASMVADAELLLPCAQQLVVRSYWLKLTQCIPRSITPCQLFKLFIR